MTIENIEERLRDYNVLEDFESMASEVGPETDPLEVVKQYHHVAEKIDGQTPSPRSVGLLEMALYLESYIQQKASD